MTSSIWRELMMDCAREITSSLVMSEEIEDERWEVEGRRRGGGKGGEVRGRKGGRGDRGKEKKGRWRRKTAGR